jgi:hypothetical protein
MTATPCETCDELPNYARNFRFDELPVQLSELGDLIGLVPYAARSEQWGRIAALADQQLEAAVRFHRTLGWPRGPDPDDVQLLNGIACMAEEIVRLRDAMSRLADRVQQEAGASGGAA